MIHTCDTPSIVLNFVTVHSDLVASNNGLKTVLFTESLGDIRTKLEANAALARTATLLFLGICPKHLHHQTRLARLALLVSVELANVVQSDAIVREETTVEHKVLGANKRRQRQSRETF